MSLKRAWAVAYCENNRILRRGLAEAAGNFVRKINY